MKKGLIFLLVIIAVAVYWFKFRKSDDGPEQPRQQPIKTSMHSAGFNSGIDQLMQTYAAMKNAFVDADTARVKAEVVKFIAVLDSIKLDELKTDSAAIYQSASMFVTDIKTTGQSLLSQTDIQEMRMDFSGINENMYPLLKTIHYEGKTLYWQNCPMAFGENKGANWISNSTEILNPYLGKKDTAMLHCGEVKDSIRAEQ